MEKNRQQELTRWLKQQSVLSRRWLNISRLLGFISGLLIVAQAWLLARILNHMIMENIPREALLMPFVVLVLVFILSRLGCLATRAGRLLCRTANSL
ncbi:cysteine/glutathione ABC transporter membrane /ATP-binding protein [Lelliottia amnigena]|nr:cysteine/glutathione ABC transporter membrane /ATP-binding protein [Lelliottia amnigena]